MRRFLLLPVVLTLYALPACREEPSKVTPPIITDTQPLGDGLKVIGFALLGASVVLTLGRFVR